MQVKKSGKDPKVGAELILGDMSRKTTVRYTEILPPFKRDLTQYFSLTPVCVRVFPEGV